MPTVVIGGGISGLACAYRLKQRGLGVALLEQSPRPGGALASLEQDGFIFDLGPQSFLSTETLNQLVTDLGLDRELQKADPRAPRYIYTGRKMHAAPMSPPGLLGTSLLSGPTKLRLLSEPFRNTHPPEADESVAAFIRRKFGADLLENLMGPFVSGVYAGDPERLSLRSAFPSAHRWEVEYGSVLKGAMKSRPPKGTPRPGLCAFRGGMATLVKALAEKLGADLHTETGVEAVKGRKANGKAVFEVHATRRGRPEMLEAEALVMTVPAWLAGNLLENISPVFAELLSAIEYAPVAVVSAGYKREQVMHPLEGFGFLVPRKENLRVLGTVWNSSLFVGRAPHGMVCVTSFAGGATDPDFIRLDDAEIAEIIGREVAGVLGVRGEPIAWHLQKIGRAIPQYNLGHGETIAAVRRQVREVPGLFLTGNYFEGPAIGACVEAAFKTAQEVERYVAGLR